MGHGDPPLSSAGVDEFGWQFGESITYGDTKFSTARVCLAFRSGQTMMDDGEYASVFDMSKLRDGLQRFDRHD